MSFTDVNIKIPREWDVTRDVNDVMHRKRARRIWGDLKKSVVELCLERRRFDFRLLTVALCRVCICFGADGKVRCYLSPYVKKPLNSKAIKSFVPELRSRQVFFVFRDSYVLYIYIYIVMKILCTF